MVTVTEALQFAGQNKLSLPKKLQCKMSFTVIHRIKGKWFALRKKIVEGMKKKKENKNCVGQMDFGTASACCMKRGISGERLGIIMSHHRKPHAL